MLMRRLRLYCLVLLFANTVLAQPAAEDADSIERSSERGPVKVTVRLSPAQPIIGDSITLTLVVTAEPEVEVLMPEFGQALDRFSIVEFLPRERLDESGLSVATQRYTLQVPLSGEQQIPPIMIEFVDRRAGQQAAPEGEDAYEIITERLPFTVQSVLPEQAGDDLKPMLGELQPLATTPTPQWPWPLLAILLLLLASLPFIWRWWQQWRSGVRQRSAYDIAYGRLQILLNQPRPDAEQMKAFFMELSAIVRRYLEDRFALHAPELTTEEFLDVAAQSPDLSREHQGFLRDFLQVADQVKFARHIPTTERVEEALNSAAHFLRQTATNINESHTEVSRA